MGFTSFKSNVEAGDVVVIFMGHDSMFPLYVKKGEISQTKFGAIKHDQIINHEYGTKFTCSRGWVYVLHPTPELWTITLPHRTQILYTADISMILFQLDLKPGSVVCESGTGSGSLSHAIIRTIAPTGFLHTVEFHEDRANKASLEFKKHGLADYVTVYHRDVIKSGFPVSSVADAVFLDIPSPDNAISAAADALKQSGGRLCSFSPCIEQVQRTCTNLRQQGSGFKDIQVFELIRRSCNVKRVFVPMADLGLDDNEVRSEVVGESNILPCAYDATDVLPLGEVVMRTNQQETDAFSKRNKRQKTSSGAMETGSNTPSSSVVTQKHAFCCRTCVLPKETYGHTGFLVFATYQPNVKKAE
ncbi:tRNA (adenine(58)-N(1))-methyltransferase catalytic subunit TRMT61A [Ciona intestinalis]